jgi:flagellar biosynthesis protein FlhG
LFYEGVALNDILCPTPYGFKILPASSGVSEMLSLDTGQKLELLEAMDVLENDLDYLIVDTGAGINDNVLYFNLAVQERLVVLTPEPTSLTDAYAMIKVMKMKHDVSRFKVLVNMADNERSARDVFTRLYMACDHFLTGVVLDFDGFIPRDVCVRKAVSRQVPFCAAEPQCPASRALQGLIKNVLSWEATENLDGNIKFFWKKLLFKS